MAYKDEYELPGCCWPGRSRVTAQFGDDAKITWNLYPPMLRSMGLGHKLPIPVVVRAAAVGAAAG
jgi:indolepyruvate ferredoxin oxidoreductase